jgi:hypothetical protein
MANNWIATVNMTCSDGTTFSINTIPGHKSHLPDGSSTSIDGELHELFHPAERLAVVGTAPVDSSTQSRQNVPNM